MTKLLTLKEARERLRKPMTQVEVAEKAELHQTYVSLLERGLRVPSDEIRRRLADAVGIAPARLLFGQAVSADTDQQKVAS